MKTLEFKDLDAFLAFLPREIEHQRGALQRTLVKSSSMLFAKARGLYGKHPPLADLADSTQAQRAGISGITTDEPLFRTGSLLRDHLETRVTRIERSGNYEHAESGVGTQEIINAYHEHGYINARTGRPVPPRPVFLLTAQESEHEIVEMFSKSVLQALFER